MDAFMNDTKVALHFLAKEVQQLKKFERPDESEFIDVLLDLKDEMEEKLIYLELQLESATKQLTILMDEKRKTGSMMNELTQKLHESEVRHSKTRRE
eukprot:CAMPEP_0172511958 /NCGR_PEP_ID=MMETSP1066-20121228/240619_1 /TAXON_ID=671091 /ORGANISM="Coscinodiscus wailesii, Strain CCMP2513" /LENGTH=96 /DNA_ID=CAMNT_0013291551 /DNA_START=147 /DNA_END=434 /DNA_ORIENTATION=-